MNLNDQSNGTEKKVTMEFQTDYSLMTLNNELIAALREVDLCLSDTSIQVIADVTKKKAKKIPKSPSVKAL